MGEDGWMERLFVLLSFFIFYVKSGDGREERLRKKGYDQ